MGSKKIEILPVSCTVRNAFYWPIFFKIIVQFGLFPDLGFLIHKWRLNDYFIKKKINQEKFNRILRYIS